MAALPLASADIGPGGAGFLAVVLLIAAAVLIFVAMSHSLKRLRKSVERGTFGTTEPGAEPTDPAQAADLPEAKAEAAEPSATPESPVSSDPGGQGGASV